MEQAEKRGYLNDEFRIFHNRDEAPLSFEYHYHEFHKIMILLQGEVQYFIEGKSYALQPYDIVLIRKGEIHRPVLQPGTVYERILIYCSPAYLEEHSTPDADLSACFQKAREEKSDVLRMPQMEKSRLFQSLTALEEACEDRGFAADLYRRAQFLRFIIELNRAARSGMLTYPQVMPENHRVAEIRRYLDDHLTESLSVDHVDGEFFLSRYHLMRIFKAATGFTINEYLTVQRLQLVRRRLDGGENATEAALASGFGTYSSYYRAAKKYAARRTMKE